MSKNNVRGLVVLAVIFVIFSVITFAVPFAMTATFWIGYLCGVIAILYQIYVFKISQLGDREAKSKFYGFPIVRIGVIYLVAQLVVSIIEMASAKFLPFWVALIINVVILGAAIVGCIATDAMREEIVSQDVALKKDVSNMRKLQSMAEALVAQCTESRLKPILQNLADELRYSDPVSSEGTIGLELEMTKLLTELSPAIEGKNDVLVNELSKKVMTILNNRNVICKDNKNG